MDKTLGCDPRKCELESRSTPQRVFRVYADIAQLVELEASTLRASDRSRLSAQVSMPCNNLGDCTPLLTETKTGSNPVAAAIIRGTSHLSVSSERVKAWRKRSKERIVEAMGGECVCCGYSRCIASLALHHLDPREKEVGFGAIRANPRSWLRIVEELRKCVLVCHNCHSEIHAEILELPHNVTRFDESYSDYREVEKLQPCIICGKEKPSRNKTCSVACSRSEKFKKK